MSEKLLSYIQNIKTIEPVYKIVSSSGAPKGSQITLFPLNKIQLTSTTHDDPLLNIISLVLNEVDFLDLKNIRSGCKPDPKKLLVKAISIIANRISVFFLYNNIKYERPTSTAVYKWLQKFYYNDYIYKISQNTTVSAISDGLVSLYENIAPHCDRNMYVADPQKRARLFKYTIKSLTKLKNMCEN